MPLASHDGDAAAITPSRASASCIVHDEIAIRRTTDAPRPPDLQAARALSHGMHDATARRRAMTISTLLTPELVLSALAADTKGAVIDALVARVAWLHPTLDARRLAEALHERERVSSTALEDGIAIPHARVERLEQPIAALARTPAGIACDAPDGILAALRAHESRTARRAA